MKEFMTKMVPVNLSDRFPFKCRMCGACCRHVRESVPLESLDAFRLAKHLRDKGENVSCVEKVLAAYAEPVLLSENGYTVFMLKTVGADDACIFLKDNRCTIHSVIRGRAVHIPLLSDHMNLAGMNSISVWSSHTIIQDRRCP